MSLDIVLPLIIITFSFLLQSIFGFGGGLIAVPLLSLVFDVKLAVSLVMIFQLFMGLLLIPVRDQIGWRHVALLAPWLIAGAGLGVLFLDWAPLTLLRVLLAAYLVGYVTFETVPRIAGGWKRVTYSHALAGTSSGMIQGLFGAGGPMLVTYFRDVCSSQESFRASVIAGLFISNILRLMVSVPSGLLSQEVWQIALPTFPFFLVALIVGHKFSNRISSKNFDVAVRVLLIGSALALIVE